MYKKKHRYEVGLEKLAHAEASVHKMQEELRNLQPVLAQSQEDTEALMVQIQKKMLVARQLIQKLAKVSSILLPNGAGRKSTLVSLEFFSFYSQLADYLFIESNKCKHYPN